MAGLIGFGDGIYDIAAFNSCVQRYINQIYIDDNLYIEFTDGSELKISDEGQSCCETRYMSTDDNLSEFSGSKLVSIELKDAPDVEDEYGVHEVQFLEVTTTNGFFVVSTHNEHNGYYGGFCITLTFTRGQ